MKEEDDSSFNSSFPSYTKAELNVRLTNFFIEISKDPANFYQNCQLLEKVKEFKSDQFNQLIAGQIKRNMIPLMFRNHFPDDFSLSQFGFATLVVMNLYNSIYSAELKTKVMNTPNTLIILKNFFSSPYYIHKNRIFYFDRIAHCEIVVYGGLESFIEIKTNQLQIK